MSLPLSSGRWTLDPVHSNILFSVRHLGISTLRGRFVQAEASLDVGDDLDTSSLAAEVELSSIDTGNSDRDGHVRSSDFFSVDTRPKMTFHSSSIEELADGRYRFTGTLALNDHSQEETLEAVFFGTEKNPLDGSTRAGFEATGRIDRTDYGINWNVPLDSGGLMLGTGIDITINTQLVGPSDG
jgi:polyisoprenoid-binding protein YceI